MLFCCYLSWHNNVSRHNTHSSLTECHARTRLARYRVYKIDLYREKKHEAAGDSGGRQATTATELCVFCLLEGGLLFFGEEA